MKSFSVVLHSVLFMFLKEVSGRIQGEPFYPLRGEPVCLCLTSSSLFFLFLFFAHNGSSPLVGPQAMVSKKKLQLFSVICLIKLSNCSDCCRAFQSASFLLFFCAYTEIWCKNKQTFSSTNVSHCSAVFLIF